MAPPLAVLVSPCLITALLVPPPATSSCSGVQPSTCSGAGCSATLPTSRRLAIASAAAVLIGSCGSASAAEPYRVAMSVLLDPQKQTRGEVIIEVVPDWAPLAAARFRELIDIGFYKRTRFHRVLQGFLPGELAIAQFGISTSRELNQAWLCGTCNRLPDERRTRSNTRGTLSFAASSQKNSRQTQVFINLADNGGIPNFLDGPAPLNQEFVPFARVVSGMELLPKLLSESSMNQAKAAYYVEEYLDAVYPKLSMIEDVRVLVP